MATAPARLSVACRPFSDFEDVLRQACRAPALWYCAQFDYLQLYLGSSAVGARTILTEAPYVDRHYLEEYVSYYASVFLHHQGPHTTRLHFFSRSFDKAELSTWLQEAATSADSYADVMDQLNSWYLGFVVVRPIPAAPIGRTVLRPYSDDQARLYIPTEGGHTVHVAGLELIVRGLPFQQQEQAVGACATTAIWSALSRVSRADGSRAPTPTAVTQAATRHQLNDRATPAMSGLELAQVNAAVRELGYSPYVLKPDKNYNEFALALKVYLRSGIPAVLLVHERNGYHAVCASGFRVSDDDWLEIANGNASARLRSRDMSRVYVHDDRFGPYLRMKLTVDVAKEITLRRVHDGPRKDPAAGIGGYVYAAVFPLYTKLRLSARELMRVAVETMTPLRSMLADNDRERLNAELYFVQSGKYLRDLYRLGVPNASRVETFACSAAVSRYLGVVRFCLDDAALVDVICDTTDIARDTPQLSPVLGVFPFDEKLVAPWADTAKQMMPWVLVG